MPILLARMFLAVLVLRACTCSNGDVDDPCLTLNGGCDGHATCSNNNGVAACNCMPGFQGDGHTCTQNPCLVDNGGCATHATCTNGDGIATCKCESGYTGDGRTCSDPCETASCGAHSTCMVSGDSYTCACNAGWQDVDGACQQTTSCADGGGCDPHATCSVTDAGMVACACEPSWTGNGMTCSPADAGTPDAGPPDAGTPDAGPPDAGKPDAGPPDAGTGQHGIGMPCEPAESSHSNCSQGLVCTDVSPLNMCTQLDCKGMTNVCGETNHLPNVCLTPSGEASFCARGCDPNVLNPCGRPDFSCWSIMTEAGTNNFCYPDCSYPASGYACPYGSICQSGQCATTPCVNGTCSDSNACFEDTSQTPPAFDCVPPCTETGNPCPAGRACDNESQTCDVLYGQVCDGDTPCTGSSVCVSFDGSMTGPGECLPSCMTDSDCDFAEGATCSIDTGQGMMVCSPPVCGSSDDLTDEADGGTGGLSDGGGEDEPDGGVDASAACAPGTTCQTIRISSGNAITACVPRR